MEWRQRINNDLQLMPTIQTKTQEYPGHLMHNEQNICLAAKASKPEFKVKEALSRRRRNSWLKNISDPARQGLSYSVIQFLKFRKTY